MKEIGSLLNGSQVNIWKMWYLDGMNYIFSVFTGGLKVNDFLRDLQVPLNCRDKILLIERLDTKEVTTGISLMCVTSSTDSSNPSVCWKCILCPGRRI